MTTVVHLQFLHQLALHQWCKIDTFISFEFQYLSVVNTFFRLVEQLSEKLNPLADYRYTTTDQSLPTQRSPEIKDGPHKSDQQSCPELDNPREENGFYLILFVLTGLQCIRAYISFWSAYKHNMPCHVSHFQQILYWPYISSVTRHNHHNGGEQCLCEHCIRMGDKEKELTSTNWSLKTSRRPV